MRQFPPQNNDKQQFWKLGLIYNFVERIHWKIVVLSQ